MTDGKGRARAAWLDISIVELLTPRNLIIAVLTVLVIWFLFTIRSVLVTLGIAGTTAFVLAPVVNWLRSKGVAKKRAVFLIFLAYIVLLLGLFVSLYSQGVGLYLSLADFSSGFIAEHNVAQTVRAEPVLVDEIVDEPDMTVEPGAKPDAEDTEGAPQRKGFWEGTPLGDWLDSRGIEVGQVEQGVGDYLRQNAGAITSLLLKASRFLFGGLGLVFTVFSLLILVPILAYYMLTDGQKLREGFLRIVPDRYDQDVSELLDRLEEKLGVLIRGQIKLCLWITVLSWVVLLIIGVKHWFVLGVIAGVTEFIPTVGPVIGALPAVIVGFIQGPAVGIWVIVAYIVVQFLENNILVPRIMGEDLGLHPLLVMLVLMSGGVIGGVMGMLLALPSAALVKVLYDEYYHKLMGDEREAEASKG